jgi:hypothetical protein
MPRNTSTPLPQPVFNEGNITPDPGRFKTPHPSDNQQFKELGNLPKKDVVSFNASRMAPDDVFSLQDALGPHEPETIKGIKGQGRSSSTPPVIPALRMRGSTATSCGWRTNSPATAGRRTRGTGRRFCFIWATLCTTSESPSTTTTSLRFPAITIPFSFLARHRRVPHSTSSRATSAPLSRRSPSKPPRYTGPR